MDFLSPQKQMRKKSFLSSLSKMQNKMAYYLPKANSKNYSLYHRIKLTFHGFLVA
jgi:hypothetical protein